MKNSQLQTKMLMTGLALDFSSRVYVFDTQTALPMGWHALKSTGDDHHNAADSNGFKGMVFINHEAKQVVVACGGTNATISSMEDIRDLIADVSNDISLATGYVPTQFIEGAVPLVESVLREIETPREYNWITVGHSLGAVLAELLAKQMAMDGFHVSAMTFDSPGTKPLVGVITGGMAVDVFPVVIYNSNPNAINTTNAHLDEAEIHCIPMEDRSNNVLKGLYTTVTGVGGAINWCVGEMKSALAAVAPVTSYIPGLQSILLPPTSFIDNTLSTLMTVPIAITKMLAKAVQTVDQHGLARFVEMYDGECDGFKSDIIVINESWPCMLDIITGRAMDYIPQNHDAIWEMVAGDELVDSNMDVVSVGPAVISSIIYEDIC